MWHTPGLHAGSPLLYHNFVCYTDSVSLVYTLFEKSCANYTQTMVFVHVLTEIKKEQTYFLAATKRPNGG